MLALALEKLVKINNGLKTPYYAIDFDDNPIGEIYDLTWHFFSVTDLGVGKRHDIPFSHIKEEWRKGIQQVCYNYLVHRDCYPVADLINLRNKMFLIAKLMGSTEWSKLDDDGFYRQFRKKVKESKFSDSMLEAIARMIKLFFVFGLTTRDVGSHKEFIKKLGHPKGGRKQNIAIPESMMIDIYNKAIDYVEKYHALRHEISESNKYYLEERQKYIAQAKETPTNNFPRSFARKNPDFDSSLITDYDFIDRQREKGKKTKKKFLIPSIQTACLIVIIGFSGVRKGEAFSFNKGKYTIINVEGIDVPILIGHNTKPNKGGKRKTEIYPTHEVALKAIELAWDCIDYARKKYREFDMPSLVSMTKEKVLKEADSLFLNFDYTRIGKSLVVDHFDRDLQVFSEAFDCTASEKDVDEFNMLNPTRFGELIFGQALPSFSPHALRRTFAVFMSRNKLADLLNIRYATKHSNLMMTALYANQADIAALHDYELDEELVNTMKQVNEDMIADQLFYIFNEAETLSGAEGESIVRERELYSGSIYQSREEILNKIKHERIHLVELPTGFCTKAECKRICNEYSCSTKIVTPEKALEQRVVRDRLIRRFDKINNGDRFQEVILEMLLAEISSIEITLEKHNITYSPFKGVIASHES